MARILVLDFEGDSLAMIKRFLEFGGHQVEGFCAPNQIEEYETDTPFDLAVINMTADCNNVNSVLQLLEDKLGGLNTIIITDSTADECLHDRPRHVFIFRPMDLEVVEAKVKQMLDESIHNYAEDTADKHVRPST